MISKNMANHEASAQQVLRQSQDMWGNNIEIFKITDNLFLRKTINNEQFAFDQPKTELLSRLLKGVNHSFLQTLTLKIGSPLELLLDYDPKDFRELAEYLQFHGQEVKETHALVLTKALIDLGALFESHFCFFPELSLNTLKVFPMFQTGNSEPQIGVRLFNPFLSDDYLLEILEVR